MTSPLAARLQGSGLYGTSTNVAEIAAPPAKAPETPRTRLKSEARENKYAGDCSTCGTNVPAGTGTITKVDGSWKAKHLTGECPTGQAVLPGLERPQATTGERGGRFTAPSVHPGIYTVDSNSSISGHRTFRVWLQAPDADFAPGETLLEVLIGSDNQSDYKTIGFVKSGSVSFFRKFREERSNAGIMADARTFMADPESALEAKHCLRCAAVLSTPESIAAGMGPTCVKLGW